MPGPRTLQLGLPNGPPRQAGLLRSGWLLRPGCWCFKAVVSPNQPRAAMTLSTSLSGTVQGRTKSSVLG